MPSASEIVDEVAEFLERLRANQQQMLENADYLCARIGLSADATAFEIERARNELRLLTGAVDLVRSAASAPVTVP